MRLLAHYDYHGPQKHDEGAYKGRLVGDVADGDGEFTWKNRSMFRGKWSEGLQDGPGIIPARWTRIYPILSPSMLDSGHNSL